MALKINFPLRFNDFDLVSAAEYSFKDFIPLSATYLNDFFSI